MIPVSSFDTGIVCLADRLIDAMSDFVACIFGMTNGIFYGSLGLI